MALIKKVYGIETLFSVRFFTVHGIFVVWTKAEKPLCHNQKLATSELFS